MLRHVVVSLFPSSWFCQSYVLIKYDFLLEHRSVIAVVQYFAYVKLSVNNCDMI